MGLSAAGKQRLRLLVNERSVGARVSKRPMGEGAVL